MSHDVVLVHYGSTLNPQVDERCYDVTLMVAYKVIHVFGEQLLLFRGNSINMYHDMVVGLTRDHKLAFTRYFFTSRRMCTNLCYYVPIPPLFGHPTSPLHRTLLRNILLPLGPPLLQHIPYNIGDDNIV